MGLFSRQPRETDSPHQTLAQKKTNAALRAAEADQYAATAESHGDHKLAAEWKALGKKQRNRRF
jgi:hypothetical protein